MTRRRWIAFGAVVVALVIVGALVWLLVFSDEQSSTSATAAPVAANTPNPTVQVSEESVKALEAALNSGSVTELKALLPPMQQTAEWAVQGEVMPKGATVTIERESLPDENGGVITKAHVTGPVQAEFLVQWVQIDGKWYFTTTKKVG